MSDNLRGILAIVASQFCFIINDSLMKLVATSSPSGAAQVIPMGEAIFIRGVMTVLIIAMLAQYMGLMGQLRTLASQRVAWRAVTEIGASIAYLFAIAGMPIGDVVGILQVVPLALTAGAALFLREHVGWRRWTATLAGFAGVLLIIRPGAAPFGTATALTIFSVTLIVIRDLLTRGLPPGVPVLLISGSSAFALMLGGLALSSWETWVWPNQTQMVWLAIAALHLVGANTWLVLSLRIGEIAVVGPFRYSVILIAVASGYLVWNEVPDVWSWVGIVIVTAAGIYTLMREQRVRRQSAPVERGAAA
jgi:drug/metabolite transporter (DMT)-like permease